MTSDFTAAAAKVINHLRQELAKLQSGRANPVLVEDILVEAYGTTTPLQQLATINAPQPRLLLIQPWDPTMIKDIEKALWQAKIGINPIVDGKLIRLPFPPMTAERRKEMTRLANEHVEHARIGLRTLREETLKHWRIAKKEGKISEDVLANETKKLQTEMDEQQAAVEALGQSKINELMTM